jgi:hypothetical protein
MRHKGPGSENSIYGRGCIDIVKGEQSNWFSWFTSVSQRKRWDTPLKQDVNIKKLNIKIVA